MHGRRLREHRRVEDQRMEKVETYGSLHGLRKIIASLFEAGMGVWEPPQFEKIDSFNYIYHCSGSCSNILSMHRRTFTISTSVQDVV